MTEQTAGLLDTSVFIARETGRPLGELPDRVAVSVITIGELQLGVLKATIEHEEGDPRTNADVTSAWEVKDQEGRASAGPLDLGLGPATTQSKARNRRRHLHLQREFVSDDFSAVSRM